MTQAQKTQHQLDTIKLLDGAIVLYKRGDLKRKASWQCRLELGDGQRTRRSLKTTNQAVAERLAMDLYTQLKGRIAADLPITSTSFNDYWDKQWLPYVEKNLSSHRYVASWVCTACWCGTRKISYAIYVLVVIE